MQWDVLCINQANATTSQDNSTISFDRETPGYKHRRKGGRQGGRRWAGRWSRYRQNERIIPCGGGAVSSGFVVATAHLYITFYNWNLLFRLASAVM